MLPIKIFLIITPKLNISDFNDISPIFTSSGAIYPLHHDMIYSLKHCGARELNSFNVRNKKRWFPKDTFAYSDPRKFLVIILDSAPLNRLDKPKSAIFGTILASSKTFPGLRSI